MFSNPYWYDGPIVNDEQFAGRQAQLQRCREAVVQKGCLSLVGGPQSGLTSLLCRVASPRFRPDLGGEAESVRFLWVDCHQFADPVDFIQHLLTELAPDGRVRIPPRWQPAFGQLIRALDGLQTAGARLVLLMDDFEGIGASAKYIEFLDRFRSLTTRCEMSLITATHQLLKTCCHMSIAESPFPNMFTVEFLGSFSTDEAMRFLERTSATSGVDLTPYREELFALSGRMPYLLQMACARYFEALARGEAVSLHAVEDRILEDAEPALRRIWDTMDNDSRTSLARLCTEGPTVPVSPVLVEKGYVNRDGICSSVFSRFIVRES